MSAFRRSASRNPTKRKRANSELDRSEHDSEPLEWGSGLEAGRTHPTVHMKVPKPQWRSVSAGSHVGHRSPSARRSISSSPTARSTAHKQWLHTTSDCKTSKGGTANKLLNLGNDLDELSDRYILPTVATFILTAATWVSDRLAVPKPMTKRTKKALQVAALEVFVFDI